MKTFFGVLLAAILFLFNNSIIQAINNPLEQPNNKYGIHVASMNDLRDAQTLVNSSGGDWGYVTFVIQSGDRNKDYWQYIFDELRQMHLIPLVRIATQPNKDYWEKPNVTEIDHWVSFLNSLNWVTENRYIIVGNEPNHAKEWGNSISPEEYADYLVTFSKKLKTANTDFFVLPAGLDLSAGNTLQTMDAEIFLRRIHSSSPEFFNSIDGWTSHSYPNPDFTGNVFDMGKRSIEGYKWEQGYLKSLGIVKNYPIFITETGWAKYDKKTTKNTRLLSEEQIANNYIDAFTKVWIDPDIVVITPFLLNYTHEPFDVFSWKNEFGFYSYYEKVRSLSKIEGQPRIIESLKVRSNYVFPFPNNDGKYTGILIIENIGQSIISSKDIALRPLDEFYSLKTGSSFDELKPFSTGAISYSLVIPGNKESDYYSFTVYKKGEDLTQPIEVKLNTLKTVEMKVEWIFDKIRSFLGL